MTWLSKALIAALCVAALYAGAALAYHEAAPRHLYAETLVQDALDTVGIEAVDQALTFARVETDRGIRLLLVQAYRGGHVTGIDLNAALETDSTDPVALFRERGYEAIALAGQTGPVLDATADDLVVPIITGTEHVAAGINYPEHAVEVDTGESFIFPKRGVVETFNTPVPATDALLDYELELGLVALEDITAAEPRQPRFGMLLVQDLTDRKLLLHRIDRNNVASGVGFPEAKGRDHYLKVGNMFVIPHDFWSYYPTVEARLYVNGDLRQIVQPRDLVWKPDRIIAEAFARIELTWPYFGEAIGLSSRGPMLPRGTIILTGTPAGVVFRRPTLAQMAFAPVDWVLGGFQGTVVDAAIERTIRDSELAGAYLQPGDVVAARAETLGVMRIPVTR